MKRSIKVILAGFLAVPVLAIGVSIFSPVVESVNAVVCEDGTTVEDGSLCAKPEDVPSCLFGQDCVFTKITNAALYVIGAISVLMLIYGGIRYTISAGDAGAITKAKDTILYAVVGLVVAVLAFAIVNFVLSSLM
ncbi:MAG: hypothetical protein WCK26_03275 [Candidatus Saccharibacteria bacterium]